MSRVKSRAAKHRVYKDWPFWKVERRTPFLWRLFGGGEWVTLDVYFKEWKGAMAYALTRMDRGRGTEPDEVLTRYHLTNLNRRVPKR